MHCLHIAKEQNAHILCHRHRISTQSHNCKEPCKYRTLNAYLMQIEQANNPKRNQETYMAHDRLHLRLSLSTISSLFEPLLRQAIVYACVLGFIYDSR